MSNGDRAISAFCEQVECRIYLFCLGILRASVYFKSADRNEVWIGHVAEGFRIEDLEEVGQLLRVSWRDALCSANIRCVIALSWGRSIRHCFSDILRTYHVLWLVLVAFDIIKGKLPPGVFDLALVLRRDLVLLCQLAATRLGTRSSFGCLYIWALSRGLQDI